MHTVAVLVSIAFMYYAYYVSKDTNTVVIWATILTMNFTAMLYSSLKEEIRRHK